MILEQADANLMAFNRDQIKSRPCLLESRERHCESNILDKMGGDLEVISCEDESVDIMQSEEKPTEEKLSDSINPRRRQA